MSLRKVWVVAVREYRTSVKSKAFVISLVAMPLMMGGGFVAQWLLRDVGDDSAKKVAIVDRSGKLADFVEAAAKVRNEQGAPPGKDGKQRTQAKYLVERIDPATVGDPPQSTLTLSDRVRKKDFFAFVEIGPKALDAAPGEGGDGRIAYHSNGTAFDDLYEWLSTVLNEQIQLLRLHQAGLDPAIVQRATQRVAVQQLGLITAAAIEGGEKKVSEAERVNQAAGVLLPLGFMMLMFLGVFVGAAPLLNSVLEEKMARIAEVLLGSVTPSELLMGKLLGTVGMSLTMVSVYLAGGYYALHHFGYADYLPLDLLLWFLVFLTLAVLMYGSMFSAIGAAVTDLKEAQSAMMPVMLLAMCPMFVWLNVVRSPTAMFSRLLSLFPPATPMLMIMRQAVPPGIPLWEPILGVVLMLLMTVLCVFAAGRVFRIGILMQGKGANVTQMIKWAIRG